MKNNKSIEVGDETDEEFVNYNMAPQDQSALLAPQKTTVDVQEQTDKVKSLKQEHLKKMLKLNHDLRFCKTCQVFKPPRTHHCSTCAKCILKMDHHCAWINSCIGFKNYKYFINMLFYVSLLLLLVAFTYAECYLDAASNYSISGFTFYFIAVNFVLMMTLAIIVTGFTCFHFWLIQQNKSTIEYCEAKRDGIIGKYDIGCLENFNQTLGKDWWFCPIQIKTDDEQTEGIKFPEKTRIGQQQNQTNNDNIQNQV